MTTTTTKTQTESATPSWASRGPRAIPKIDVPRARSLDAHGDITANTRLLVVFLVTRPFVALVSFIAMAQTGTWIATPIVVWFMYGSTLTAIHHLIHSSLGLTPRWRHLWLTVLGCLVGESAHGMMATHVLHHRDGSDSPDPEGYLEHLTWGELPVGAFKFRYRLALWGWNHGTSRRRVGTEMGIYVLAHVAAVALLPVTPLVLIYLALMHAGSIGFAVLLSKGPQTNFGREIESPLMIVHSEVLAFALFNHHFHLEHHAYPKVPLARLKHVRTTVEDALTDEHVTHIHIA